MAVKITIFNWKFTISMAIFNSFLYVYQRVLAVLAMTFTTDRGKTVHVTVLQQVMTPSGGLTELGGERRW
jgi:hypothetical protein